MSGPIVQEDYHFVRVTGDSGPVVNCTCGRFAQRYSNWVGLAQIVKDVEGHLNPRSDYEIKVSATSPTGMWSELRST